MVIFGTMNIVSKCFYSCQKSQKQVILGTPFLAQIYPFTVNSKWIYSNILGKETKFKFSSLTKIKDIAALQEALISKIISTKGKQ